MRDHGDAAFPPQLRKGKTGWHRGARRFTFSDNFLTCPSIMLILNDLIDSVPKFSLGFISVRIGFFFGFARSQLALTFGRPLILSDLRVARRALTLAFGFVLASFFSHLIDSKERLASF